MGTAIRYQSQIPPARRFNAALRAALEGRVTLTQPRAGVTLVDDHIALLRYMETEGEADLLPTTIDSYTRLNRYEKAAKGVEESRLAKRNLLNGFPAVNHGVDACRRVTESVSKPIQVRHGTPDARLLAEITLAAGFTAFEGGGISYNVPYAKDVSLEKTLLDWQYIDRLVGEYADSGVIINREPFGPLTGTLVPPCISHTVAVIETLLAAQQGVKCISVGYGQCGNLVQDVAALTSLQDLTQRYLEEAGFSDVHVTTVLHQWMGGFPTDEARAYAVISWGAAAAALAKATKVIVKTPHEAFGVPTKEANACGLKTTRQTVTMLSDQDMRHTPKVVAEIEVITAETTAILEKTRELGEGDWALGTVRAFQAGVIDVPFAPCTCNAGQAMPVRDLDGAVRFFETGNLPFPRDILELHRQKVEDRAKAEKRTPSFQMVTDDIYAISKGFLVGKPK